MAKLLGLLVGVAALAGISTSAKAVPIIEFDDVSQQGGSITYNGTGGSLIGAGILFDTIVGSDTPQNAGPIACNGCVLSFTTGLNTLQDPASGIWIFAGGGSFIITGTVPDAGGASGTLVSGTFTNAKATSAGGTGNLDVTISGFGIDTKNEDLLTYFGLGPTTSFTFANTEIAARASVGTNGSISGSVHDADLINTAQIPEPATLGLLGVGLLGLGAMLRRRTV